MYPQYLRQYLLSYREDVTAGPSTFTSQSRTKYSFSAEDETSHYKPVAFVKPKYEIANEFKGSISKTLHEADDQVLKVITDNGSEFCNKDLYNYLAKQGILHETSAAYVPQQNGFVEQDIQIIKESARMLLD